MGRCGWLAIKAGKAPGPIDKPGTQLRASPNKGLLERGASFLRLHCPLPPLPTLSIPTLSKPPEQPLKSLFFPFRCHLCHEQRSHPLMCLGSSRKHHSKGAQSTQSTQGHPRRPPRHPQNGPFSKTKKGKSKIRKPKYEKSFYPAKRTRPRAGSPGAKQSHPPRKIFLNLPFPFSDSGKTEIGKTNSQIPI